MESNGQRQWNIQSASQAQRIPLVTSLRTMPKAGQAWNEPVIPCEHGRTTAPDPGATSSLEQSKARRKPVSIRVVGLTKRQSDDASGNRFDTLLEHRTIIH
jgi:hypothetical protein